MNPTTELKELQSELQKTRKQIEKYRTILLEFGSDCGADFMHEKYKENEELYDDLYEFCKKNCPFERCEWDCFAKEIEEMCESDECDGCPDLNFCESPHGKDWREASVPTDWDRNGGAL